MDDDLEMREALMAMLSVEGHTCELAADAVAAQELLDKQTYDLVISDILMAGMSGLELLDRVKRTHPGLPFIAVTGAGGPRQAVDAVKRGAFDYLVKPCDPGAIRRVVKSALQGGRPVVDRPRRSQPPAPPGPADEVGLIGIGPAMLALQTSIDFVARSNAPVLVTGETGVGKELVARAIHARSSRHHQPLIAVNTSAIPEDLLEGEIFGYVRGAFTGAVQPRKGLLTEADGGTLLLDEIGDMPVALQAKLLRVVQFGDVRPVGSDRTHHVDVRLIAATHRDLPALVQEGHFREDLYYRLNVLPVSVPPLRDRPEDIPALAVHFLAEARRRAPLSPVRALGQDALHALTEWPWPGNVRELESCVERAVVFGSEETVDANRVALALGTAQAPGSGGRTQSWPFPKDAPWTLRQLSRAYAHWALGETGGDKESAARILGVDLSTLYRWLRSERASEPMARKHEPDDPGLEVARTG